MWQGAAYFWFWIVTFAAERHMRESEYKFFTVALGLIGAASMTLAVALTLYSLFLYVRDYGRVIGAPAKSA